MHVLTSMLLANNRFVVLQKCMPYGQIKSGYASKSNIYKIYKNKD